MIITDLGEILVITHFKPFSLQSEDRHPGCCKHSKGYAGVRSRADPETRFLTDRLGCLLSSNMFNPRGKKNTGFHIFQDRHLSDLIY